MKREIVGLFTVIFLVLYNNRGVNAQPKGIEKDSTEIYNEVSKEIRSPKKASIYSALFPGLGQIYNKKYWKLPLIYGGFAALFYGFTWNNNLYNEYYEAFRTISQYSNPKQITPKDREYLDNFINNPAIVLDDPAIFSNVSRQIGRGKDFYRRNRDLVVIVMAGIHILNIIDASVDAHLFDYDISTDLSLNIAPAQINLAGNNQIVGIVCKFNF